MNIVYVSNDNYCKHLAASMHSLLTNNQDAEQINIFIISINISEENVQKLKTISSRFHRKLIIIPTDDLASYFSYKIDTGSFDISAMGRLFVGTLLPQNIHRILYLDCDTIVLGSIKHLWDSNLRTNIIGAVMEPTIYTRAKASIGLTIDDPYYNSGILLIDLEKWRFEEIEKKLLDFYQSLGGKSLACDQDTLNGTLKGKIQSLSPKYNFFTNYRYFHYYDLVKYSSTYKQITKKNFELSKKRPVILHYAGDERPWKRGYWGHYKKEYETYLNQTPWKNSPKEKGQELHLFLYHIMNELTWICPPIRRFINHHIGMKVLENRSKK